MNIYNLIFFLFLNILSSAIVAQNEVIPLNNGGFEDEPRYAKAPKGWYNCGAPEESPPDIHPIPDSDFQVTHRANEGRTYIGLVVRDNQTTEAVGQRLKTKLKKDQCYQISLMLCRSKVYESESRKTGQAVNYNMPTKIKLWGGRDYCDKKELLSSSSPIQNTTWKEYRFQFQPTESHAYLLIEATYGTANVDFYNGNVLIDNASDIKQISCGDEPKEIAAVETPVVQKPVVSTPIVEAPVVEAEKEPRPASKSSRSRPNYTSKFVYYKNTKLKLGETLPLRRVFFEADKAMTTENSNASLDELFTFLSSNKNVSIEIGGHTNSTPPDAYCDKLSTERAKYVVNYLQRKGINSQQLSYKGYGKRKPLMSNKTEMGRTRNQRVEIKIIRLD